MNNIFLNYKDEETGYIYTPTTSIKVAYLTLRYISISFSIISVVAGIILLLMSRTALGLSLIIIVPFVSCINLTIFGPFILALEDLKVIKQILMCNNFVLPKKDSEFKKNHNTTNKNSLS